MINFKLFNQCEIPEPVKANDTIVLLSENKEDGVGDFDHVKTYISLIRENIQDKDYKIIPIVTIHRYDPIEGNDFKVENARADYVEGELEKLKSKGVIFDYVLVTQKHSGPLNSSNLPGKMQKIEEVLNEGAAFFRISYGEYFFREISNHIKTKLNRKVILCAALNNQWNRKNVEEVFQSASMGLPRGDPTVFEKDVSYGLPVAPIISEEQKISLILDFHHDTEKGRELLSAMIGHDNATLSDVKAYYQSHAIMPGYPQSTIAATNFILIGILKHLNHKKEIDKPIDFFLPKGIVEEEYLREMLLQIAPNVEFEIITPQSQSSLSTTNKVRIFSGFRLDDVHYSNLYSARNDLGLGSGDNTLIKAVSSDILPLFQDKPGSIREFNIFGIVTLIQTLISEEQDAKTQQQLNDLKDYFINISGFVKASDSTQRGTKLGGMFDVANVGSGSQKWDFDQVRKNLDGYFEYLNRIAHLAKNPDVQQAWEMVAEKIARDFDYRDNFKGILSGAILMNNPNLKSRMNDGQELNFEEIVEQATHVTKKDEKPTVRRKPITYGQDASKAKVAEEQIVASDLSKPRKSGRKPSSSMH